MSTYQQCVGWRDVTDCVTSLASSNNTLGLCTEVIDPNRAGYCSCHNEHLGISASCNHVAFKCEDICDDGINEGCSPASKLGVLYARGKVFGCNGPFTSIANAESELCDTDYHICTHDELINLELTSAECSTGPMDAFYSSEFSSNLLIYGCGNQYDFNQIPVSNTSFSPFALVLDENEFDGTGLWRLNNKADDDQELIDRLYKVSDSGGGVLCCKNEDELAQIGAIEFVGVVLQLIGVILVVFCLLLCLAKICIPLFNRCGCCCVRDRILNICGCRIPTSLRAWKESKRIKLIESIKCGTFKEFQSKQSADIISDESAHCVICLGDYEDDEMLIYLKCGHHYHQVCGTDWLKQAEICPICRQDFRTAKNSKVRNESNEEISDEVEMKELDFESVNNNV